MRALLSIEQPTSDVAMKQSACTDQSGTFSDLKNLRGTTSRATHNDDDDLRGIARPGAVSIIDSKQGNLTHLTMSPHDANRLALPRLFIHNHERPALSFQRDNMDLRHLRALHTTQHRLSAVLSVTRVGQHTRSQTRRVRATCSGLQSITVRDSVQRASRDLRVKV